MRGVTEEFQIQSMSINHLEPHIHSHIIEKFSSCLTENKLHLHYKYQLSLEK